METKAGKVGFGYAFMSFIWWGFGFVGVFFVLNRACPVKVLLEIFQQIPLSPKMPQLDVGVRICQFFFSFSAFCISPHKPGSWFWQ